MSLKNKYIAVIGAGESGVGAALLAQKLGAEVFVSDYGNIKENYKKELEENSFRSRKMDIVYIKLKKRTR